MKNAQRRRSLIVLTIAFGWAMLLPIQSQADDKEPKLRLGNGLELDARGRKTNVPSGQSVDISLDFEDLWPSITTHFPTSLGVQRNGQDLSNLSNPDLKIIFETGEVDCTNQILRLVGGSLGSKNIFDGAVESAVITVKIASKVLLGGATAEILEATAEIFELYIESNTEQEFTEKIQEWIVTKIVKELINKILGGEGFLEDLYDKGADELYADIKELINGPELVYETSWTSQSCGELQMRFELFSEHPDVPRQTRPSSLLMGVAGDCGRRDVSARGSLGGPAKIGQFVLRAEYEIHLSERRRGPWQGTALLRAISPQIFLKAECGPVETEDWSVPVSAPVGEDLGPSRPTFVEDDIIAFADWSKTDQACYDEISADYDDWYLARREYRNGLITEDKLEKDIAWWTPRLGQLPKSEASTQGTSYRQNVEEKLREFNKSLRALVSSGPKRKSDYLNATRILMPMVQECVDRHTNSAARPPTHTEFGEKLMEVLSIISLWK